MSKCENCKHFYECDNTGNYNECKEYDEIRQEKFIIELTLDVETGMVVDGSINTGIYNRTEFASDFDPATIKETAEFIKEELSNYLD